MSASVTAFARTLDQELLALSRGASLECPCCGEFVLRLRGVLARGSTTSGTSRPSASSDRHSGHASTAS